MYQSHIFSYLFSLNKNLILFKSHFIFTNICICLSRHQGIIIGLLFPGHHTKTNSHQQTATLTPSYADFDSEHFHPNIHVNLIRTHLSIDLSCYKSLTKLTRSSNLELPKKFSVTVFMCLFFPW